MMFSVSPFHFEKLDNDDGSTYFEEWAFKLPWKKPSSQVEIAVHRLKNPDKSVGMHPHVHSFVTFIICGGYTEKLFYDYANKSDSEKYRSWNVWSKHYVPKELEHQIISVKPHTWTITFRKVTY